MRRARVRGETNRWVIRLGSMILPGPTTTLPDDATCSSPLAVKGISLLPVYRPEIDHSVSPVLVVS